MKKTIPAVFVSMAILCSLCAKAGYEAEVDSTFTYINSPMCIPAFKTAVDYGQVNAEDVIKFITSATKDKTLPIETRGFDIDIANCPAGTNVQISANNITDLKLDDANGTQLLGAVVGTGKAKYFAVVHGTNPDKGEPAFFSTVTPTVSYVLEKSDKIPMTGILLALGGATSIGEDDPQLLSEASSISNGTYSLTSKYTITML